MKIVVVTCYFDPDYVRARTLRTALKQMPGVQTIVVKNRHKGLLRYPEIMWKLWQVKRQQHPDSYLLTFRGQEILPFVLLLAGKKPVIFDEFIVPIAYATGENHRLTLAVRVKYFLAQISEPLYKTWLHHCKAILADTKAHAELSARLSHTNLSNYLALPVGADEALFKPSTVAVSKTNFQVFYYSLGMQPLHGIEFVLQAAELLKGQADIEFLIVGGKRPLEQAVMQAVAAGAQVRYLSWVPFDELLATIHGASLCLGGPFGGTPQAGHVITGKTYQFLASAMPVVVGASDATAEYFVDKQNSLVVAQADAQALASAITWAKAHPSELHAIAMQGRALYEKEFSNLAIKKLLEPLVSSL